MHSAECVISKYLSLLFLKVVYFGEWKEFHRVAGTPSMIIDHLQLQNLKSDRLTLSYVSHLHHSNGY